MQGASLDARLRERNSWRPWWPYGFRRLLRNDRPLVNRPHAESNVLVRQTASSPSPLRAASGASPCPLMSRRGHKSNRAVTDGAAQGGGSSNATIPGRTSSERGGMGQAGVSRPAQGTAATSGFVPRPTAPWAFKTDRPEGQAPLNAHVSHNEDHTLLRSADSCGLSEGVERANLGQAIGADWSGSWT